MTVGYRMNRTPKNVCVRVILLAEETWIAVFELLRPNFFSARVWKAGTLVG